MIETKIDNVDAQADNSGFCNIGAEAIPISIGSLFGFGSGRSFSIIFCTFFVHLFFNRQRFRAENFQIPQHRKALSLAVSNPPSATHYPIIPKNFHYR
jgi:hypothetical protein